MKHFASAAIWCFAYPVLSISCISIKTATLNAYKLVPIRATHV